MKICTLAIPFFSDAIPQPASLSPPLITASALLPTSHLSSLHHQKEVKILHSKTHPLPFIPSFLASLILTSCLISLSFHSWCPLPPSSHTLPHRFFCRYLSTSHPSDRPSLFLFAPYYSFLLFFLPLSSCRFSSTAPTFSFCQYNER